MSGGGGGTGGALGGDDVTDKDCGDIIATTTLSSPNPEVLGALETEDLLEIRLREDNSIGAYTHDDNLAGTITFAYLPRLIECLEEGYAYVARVLSIDDGACEVQVRPTQKS